MYIASVARRVWFESKLPLYVERFIIPILAGVVLVVVMQNVFNLTWDQRVAVFLVVASTAYLIATALHRTQAAAPPLPAVATPAPPAIKDEPLESSKSNPPAPPEALHQSSEGANSPNVATFGPHSPVTINQGLPWTLDDAQRQAIAATVRPYLSLWDGKFEVVTANMGDGESQRMAEAVVEAFRAGGWQLSGYGQALSVPPPEGISLAVPGNPVSTNELDPELVPFLRALSTVLRQTGLITDLLVVSPTKGMGEDQRFAVRIGRRPH